MAHYRKAYFSDCEVLADKMRESDKQEVWHSDGMSPLVALQTSYDASSECHTIISDDGDIIGMFGVAPSSINGCGAPWLLASEELRKCAREFIPQSKAWIETIHDDYDLLFNYVHAANTVSIRWLKWLGFNFVRELEYGVNPSQFIEFCKHRGS